MSENLKQKAVKGILWQLAETGGRQCITFVVSVILARLIMPDQFGMIAMLAVFISISDIFINAGFSTALIRKLDCTQEDYSSVYWVNIIISVLCYIILFFCAPAIASFYSMPTLSLILRVTASGLIIGSLSGVHRTILTSKMNFKAMTKYNLLGLLISGIVGIVLAYKDFKVWALVYQNLTLTTITTICFWHQVKWRPSFIISKSSLKELFGFSSKLFASQLLGGIYGNISTMVIGKIYKASDLAFYDRSYGLSRLTSSMPTSILQSVTFPTLSKLQNDTEALKDGYRRIIKLSAFIIFPLCMGMGAVAYPLVTILYTDKWIFTASLLSIIVFAEMWYPIHAINLNYLVVIGRSDLFFRLEVIKKIQGVIILAATVPFGLKMLCYGSIIGSLLSLVWNTYYTGKFLKMSIFRQIKDVGNTLILCIVMYIFAKSMATLLGNGIISLICSVSVGIIVYVFGAIIFKFPEVKELRNLRK